jgi:predicted dehydrogenase
MTRYRIAIEGRSHLHLADHLSALRRHGIELVADPARADAAIAGGGPADRERSLPELLRLGVPVLAEKPLARSAAATAAVLRAGGDAVTTAMFLRCGPAMGALKELLAAGALGDLTAVHAVFSHAGWWQGRFTGAAAWMTDPALLPGGGLTDLAVHLLDALLWLDGSRPLTVRTAVAGRPVAGPVVAGSALLDWAGAPVTLHAGWTSRPGGLRVEIDGSAGRAVLTDGALSYDAGTGTGPRILCAGPAPAAEHAVDAFIEQLRGGTRVLPGAADILRCATLTDDLAAAAS